MTVRPRRLLALALVLAACQAGPRPVPTAELEARLTALELQPGEGTLTVALPVPAAAVGRLTWEVSLEGHPFALGLETAPRPTPEGLVFDAPLVWRHFGWKEGSRYVRVAVRGRVLGPGEVAGRPVRGSAELLVPGAPVLEAPVEE